MRLNLKNNKKIHEFITNIKRLKKLDKNLLTYPIYGALVILFSLTILSLIAKINVIVSISFVVMISVLFFITLFGLRVKKASYKYIESVPGGAAYILEILNKKLKNTVALDKAIKFDRSGRIVHRAIGAFGVVFLIEGKKNGADKLVLPEIKKINSFDSSIATNNFYVEDYPGDLEKIYKKIKKLKKSLNGKKIKNTVDALRALR